MTPRGRKSTVASPPSWSRALRSINREPKPRRTGAVTCGPPVSVQVSVGVPKDDRFQVISEHDSENFVFDLNYLDIRRTEDLVIIQITWNEGRTVEQKKALYKAIADGLAATLSLRREDVFIVLVEVKKENWSFGNGVAQYA